MHQRCLVLVMTAGARIKARNSNLKLKPPLLAGTTYILYFVATSTLYGTKRYEVQYQNQSMNVYFSPVVVGLFRVIAYASSG
jgi:hypothetical protein